MNAYDYTLYIANLVLCNLVISYIFLTNSSLNLSLSICLFQVSLLLKASQVSLSFGFYCKMADWI